MCITEKMHLLIFWWKFFISKGHYKSVFHTSQHLSWCPLAELYLIQLGYTYLILSEDLVQSLVCCLLLTSCFYPHHLEYYQYVWPDQYAWSVVHNTMMYITKFVTVCKFRCFYKLLLIVCLKLSVIGRNSRCLDPLRMKLLLYRYPHKGLCA